MSATTTITKIERLPDESIKIFISAGSSFLVRARYVQHGDETAGDFFCEGDELNAGDFSLLFTASQSYRAEKKARELLYRSEQCRFLLTQKLLKKNFDEAACNAALDYLQEKTLLDDARYARSWLAERAGKRAEGRLRLEAELAKRGIAKEIIQKELDAFFESHDEDASCRAAFEKAVRLKKDDDAVRRYLFRLGFSFSQIKRAANYSEDE